MTLRDLVARGVEDTQGEVVRVGEVEREMVEEPLLDGVEEAEGEVEPLKEGDRVPDAESEADTLEVGVVEKE